MLSLCVAQPEIAGTSAQKPALFRFMHDDFDLHDWFLLSTKGLFKPHCYSAACALISPDT